MHQPLREPTSPARRRLLRVSTLMAAVLAIGIPVGALTVSVRKAREAARASQCLCNLCSINLALHNYHAAYGQFPPASIADASGRPMHSWRVLILPYMEHGPLYNSYDLAEPWDGPNNRRLLDRRPAAYDCPSRGAGPSSTSYVAVAGPGTAFPDATTRSLDDIRDGVGRTILVGEVANVAIPWTEPRDLDTRTMSWAIDDPTRPGFSSLHDAGPAVILADGSYRRLGKSRSPALLKALTTIAGGEPGELEPAR